ncbi:MAG: oligosaccharide flippase family protein [Ignavibacteriaceae bacterium]
MFDKLKQLTKDTAIYGISTMLSRFLTFLLTPVYTKVFIPEAYGVMANIYAFIGLMTIIYIYGMDSAYIRFASTNELGDKKDNFSTPFFSVVGTSILLSLILFVFSGSINAVFSIPGEYYYLLYYAILILMLDSLAAIPFITLRLERKAKTFALYKTLNILLNVALNLFLIFKLKWGIEAAFFSNFAASLLSLILLIPLIIKNLKFSFHFSLFKRLLKFGLPYFPAGMAVMLVQLIDRPIMESLTNYTTVGIYQANHKLGIIMMLFVNMFQYAWQPFFMQESKEENAKQMFSKVLTYFTLAGSIILIVLSLFISDLVKIEIFGIHIIGPAYWSGLYVVPVVLFGYLFNGMYVVFTAGIYIKEKSMYVPLITGIGAAVSIASNFILIPAIGMIGAAYAALFSYLSMAGGYYIVTQKFYKIEYENARIIKIFASILVVGSIYYALLFNNNLLFIYKVMLLFLFCILIYLFAVDKDEINSIKRRLFKTNTGV